GTHGPVPLADVVRRAAGSLEFRLLDAGGYAAAPVLHGSHHHAGKPLWRFGHCGLCSVADGTLPPGVLRHAVRPAVCTIRSGAYIFGGPAHAPLGGITWLAGLFCSHGCHRLARPLASLLP